MRARVVVLLDRMLRKGDAVQRTLMTLRSYHSMRALDFLAVVEDEDHGGLRLHLLLQVERLGVRGFLRGGGVDGRGTDDQSGLVLALVAAIAANAVRQRGADEFARADDVEVVRLVGGRRGCGGWDRNRTGTAEPSSDEARCRALLTTCGRSVRTVEAGNWDIPKILYGQDVPM